MQWAQEMTTYFLHQVETPNREIAFVHTIDAQAAVTGDATRHSQAYQRATSAIDSIKDEQDREIVWQIFKRTPRPRALCVVKITASLVFFANHSLNEIYIALFNKHLNTWRE
ncbi:MAG: hypothetical protein ACI9SB_000469 [Candidatus Azotimanducaceae bacterium]|jgi:hypothetical protein